MLVLQYFQIHCTAVLPYVATGTVRYFTSFRALTTFKRAQLPPGATQQNLLAEVEASPTTDSHNRNCNPRTASNAAASH